MMPTAFTVNEMKKQASRLGTVSFFINGTNNFSTQPIHGKRSLRSTVTLLSYSQGVEDRFQQHFRSWFKVDMTKMLKTFEHHPQSYHPKGVRPRYIPFDKYDSDDTIGERNYQRLSGSLFKERTGGLCLFGFVNRWHLDVYPYAFFQSEMDAMYFVVDNDLVGG